MLDIAGWSQPWDDTRIVDLDGYPRLGSEGVRR
jgi:hypothetical protein